MFGLSWIKMIGGGVAFAALAALVWLAQDRFHQKSMADAANECDAAAEKGELFLDDCLPNVRNDIQQAQRARQCDISLGREQDEQGRFGIRMSCSAPVKKLYAERDAARSAQAAAEQLLADERARTDAAVTRAEARATQAEKRSSNARTAIEAAPLEPDGLKRCDAECLRNVAGH